MCFCGRRPESEGKFCPSWDCQTEKDRLMPKRSIPEDEFLQILSYLEQAITPTVPYMENDPEKMKSIAEALRKHCIDEMHSILRKY